MVSFGEDDSDKESQQVKRSRNQYKRVSNAVFSYQGKSQDEFPLHGSEEEMEEKVVRKKKKSVSVPSNPEEFAAYFSKFVRENPGFDKFCKEERAMSKKPNVGVLESGRQICQRWQELGEEEKESYMEEHEKRKYREMVLNSKKQVKKSTHSNNNHHHNMNIVQPPIQPTTHNNNVNNPMSMNHIHNMNQNPVNQNQMNSMHNFIPYHPISTLTNSIPTSIPTNNTETPRTTRLHHALEAVDQAFSQVQPKLTNAGNDEYINTYKQEYTKQYAKYKQLQLECNQLQDDLEAKQQRDQVLLEELTDLRIQVKHYKRSIELDEVRYKRLLEEHEVERQKQLKNSHTPSKHSSMQSQLDKEQDARKQQGLQIERQSYEQRQSREELMSVQAAHAEEFRRLQLEWEKREDALRMEFRRKEEEWRQQLARSSQSEAKALSSVRGLTERNKTQLAAQEEVHDDVARVLNAFALLTGVSIDIDKTRVSVFECRAECVLPTPAGYPAPRYAVFELEITQSAMVYRPRQLEPRQQNPANDFIEEMVIDMNQGPFFIKTLFTYLLDPIKYCTMRTATEQQQQQQQYQQPPPQEQDDRKKPRNKRK